MRARLCCLFALSGSCFQSTMICGIGRPDFVVAGLQHPQSVATRWRCWICAAVGHGVQMYAGVWQRSPCFHMNTGVPCCDVTLDWLEGQCAWLCVWGVLGRTILVEAETLCRSLLRTLRHCKHICLLCHQQRKSPGSVESLDGVERKAIAAQSRARVNQVTCVAAIVWSFIMRGNVWRTEANGGLL